MNPIPFQMPIWDSVQYDTFSRSSVANYHSTTSIVEDSAIELLKNSILLIDSNDIELSVVG